MESVHHIYYRTPIVTHAIKTFVYIYTLVHVRVHTRGLWYNWTFLCKTEPLQLQLFSERAYPEFQSFTYTICLYTCIHCIQFMRNLIADTEIICSRP